MMPAQPPLKVLFVSSEASPLAKVGGLGDVVGALPMALRRLGVDARIVIPKYKFISPQKYPLKKIKDKIPVKFGKTELINLYKTFLPDAKVPVYLVGHSRFYRRADVYFAAPGRPYSLYDKYRFTFLVKAALDITKHLKWQPDIYHAHDWHTGLLPVLLKINPVPRCAKTIFTIHNLTYQHPMNWLEIKNLFHLTGRELPSLKVCQKNQEINYLEQAIINADLVNTVSPAYAREILTKEHGAGLEKMLQKRKNKNQLFGILNGIDARRFNPAADPDIAQKYNLQNLSLKIKNKIYLQKKCFNRADANTPIIGLVTRLAEQKGLDLLLKILPQLTKEKIQLVILGAGWPKYEKQFKKLAKKYPKTLYLKTAFDAKFAQEIYAGSDIFMMPSRFEPCGLGQMIAMRYGAVPLVRATGGLKDTVINYTCRNIKKATGFSFEKYQANELLKTTRRALMAYAQPKIWRRLQTNGMKQDFSWDKSAREYLRLYKRLARGVK